MVTASLATLPKSICWHAVGMKWDVQISKSAGNRRLRVEFSYPNLHIVLPANKQNDCFAIYKRWFVQQADSYLTAILQELSASCDLAFSSVSYGHQKSLWGSCSAHKQIRLNAKLLYLPPRLMRYVLIHELCHTVHMNHQPEFWSLVERFVPDYRELKRQMRYADRYIPVLLNR